MSCSLKGVPSPIFDTNNDKFKLRIIPLNQVFKVTFKNIVYLKPDTERNEGKKKQLLVNFKKDRKSENKFNLKLIGKLILSTKLVDFNVSKSFSCLEDL